jgi:nicotinate-nucleotide pyrophosphorylase (carboxylating)
MSRTSTAHRASSGPPPAADPRGSAPDVRDVLFAPVAGRTFPFTITVAQRAVLAGSSALARKAAELGVEVEWLAQDGARLEAGMAVCHARGDAWQVVRAEETLLATLGKASGVATAAAELVAATAGRARVVCGAWKKVAPELRGALRDAVMLGGAGMRILDRPFVYLDKNYVRMLGGVVAAVRRGRGVEGRAVVVQLRGGACRIDDEAEAAVDAGADLLMVDTGQVADLAAVAGRLRATRPSSRVVLAFGGGVRLDGVDAILDAGATVLDVGRAILDAPLVDFRLDVR